MRAQRLSALDAQRGKEHGLETAERDALHAEGSESAIAAFEGVLNEGLGWHFVLLPVYRWASGIRLLSGPLGVIDFAKRENDRRCCQRRQA